MSRIASLSSATWRASLASFLRQRGAGSFNLAREARERSRTARCVAPLAGRVLDLGCGRAGLRDLLPRAGCLLGLDPSPDPTARGAFDLLLAGVGESLPLRDAALDAVILRSVLDQSRDPELLLDEVRRVLRPGGRLYLYHRFPAGDAPRRAVLPPAVRTLLDRIRPLSVPHRIEERLLRNAIAARFPVTETEDRDDYGIHLRLAKARPVRPLRLLHLLQRPLDALGGAERQAALLAAHLCARGHTVEVHAARNPLSHALRVFAVRPDLVHAHLLSGHAFAALFAARSLGIPVVVKVGASRAHGDVATSRATVLGRAKLALAVRCAAGWIAPNEECAEELRGAGVEPARIRVIPNGVDLARIRPRPHSAEPVVLFAGRLAEQKGIDRLLAAWPAVASARPGARLLVAGDGPLRPEVERFAAAHSDVEVLGPLSELAPAFARAMVFVLPSRAEGVSNALLEAMASGLAPVATRIGGNEEVLDGGAGILVSQGGPGPLAEGILMALKVSERLGEAARNRVVERYGIEAAVAEVESLYLDILSKPPYNPSR